MQINNALISVIVTIHNLEDYITDCINSILNQSYSLLEIIVIDDGSVDDSWKIIEEFKNIDPRIIAIRQTNKGVSYARNVGIVNSKGNYITFVDGDDVLDLKTYEYAYNAIQDHSGIDCVQFPIIYNWGSKRPFKHILCSEYFSKVEILSGFLMGELTFSTCDKLFKRSVFSNLNFVENIRYEDFNICIDFVEVMRSVKIIDKGCYFYRYRSNSFTQYSSTIEREYNYLEIAERINKKALNFSELLGQLTRFSIFSLCQISEGVFNSKRKEIKDLNKYQILNISFTGFAISLVKGHLTCRLFFVGLLRLLFGINFSLYVFSQIRSKFKFLKEI